MQDVVLIGCTKSKRDRPSPARELYQESDLFQKRLRYAEWRDPDLMLVLSAKHHVLEMDEIVAPYDVTLYDMSAGRVRAWATEVCTQLREVADLERDRFIILAGRKYYEELLAHLSHVEIPTEGMKIGETKSFLGSAIESETNTGA